MKSFAELTEREMLALAITNKEEDGRIYADFAKALGEDHADSARIFVDMAKGEGEKRRELIGTFTAKFGDHIPLIARQNISNRSRGLAEAEAVAVAVAVDERQATENKGQRLTGERQTSEDEAASRRFILHIIQPGLVGLMDGSVSTLAPVFAAAFATHNSWNAFQVGMAASLGAGISMGFAEALADDGKLSGRGTPLLRGVVCGLMTVAGGIGHTIPYLIPSFYTATIVAGIVVLFELLTIAWIQWRYMDTPPVSAAAKVMLGGGLVLATGILIGSS
jgi:erythrin-vacuolar iron transport family protein